MQCPHIDCRQHFKVQHIVEMPVVPSPANKYTQMGANISSFFCPACNKIIVNVTYGNCVYNEKQNKFIYSVTNTTMPNIIYPKNERIELTRIDHSRNISKIL